MKSIFVTGSDTGVGKTWVVSTLASMFAAQSLHVQIVKPVQTGASRSDKEDVSIILDGCNNELVTGYTFFSFLAPVAPLYAAQLEGESLSYEALMHETHGLPPCDIRIFEGAGSAAVPIDEDGRDWSDFAMGVSANSTVAVVENRIGAIGQSRFLITYLERMPLKFGLWLNEIEPQSEVERESTLKGIDQLGLPIWATQARGSRQAVLLNRDWLSL